MTADEKDDQFDAWLKDAARDYNRPPDIAPKDAMWDAIRATRLERDRNEPIAIGGARFTKRSGSWFNRWTLAAAATLLLTAGIGIGYWAHDAGRTAAPAVVASDVGQPAPAPVIARPTSYDVAAVQHLTSAQALLTVFRDDSSTSEATLKWTRDLLSTTRLLLDSPAARDPGRRKLLEDLEGILVQMVQLPEHGGALDRRLIDQTIARQQVLTRLRTSIPAGQAGGT